MKNPDFSVLNQPVEEIDLTIKKIHAIMIVRATFNLNLKQAKDLVDSSFGREGGDISITNFGEFMNKCFNHFFSSIAKK